MVTPRRGGAPVERSRRLRPRPLFSRLRGLAAVILKALIVYALHRYPLASWPLATALLAYAALLWRFPAAFLFVLPVVLPALDLGLWTGWMVVGESDLFVLATLSVLLVRLPPGRQDLLLTGVARWVILAVTAIWIIAAGIGLLSPLGAEPSDNPYLRPDNALRLAKSLAEATALLPFLHHRQRSHGDAVARFGLGMAAGLAAVTLVVLAERMLFTGVLDFSGAYRVAGPFSSMRVGGGHIGAYAALALPFTLCLSLLRPRWLAAGLLGLAGLAGGYTLAVTFARTAYAAGLVGMAVAGAAWLWARRRRRAVAAWVVLAPVALMLAGLAAAAGLTGMRERFAETAPDYATRAGNWQAGLAARDTGLLGTLFGLGLGTYQRAMLTRSAVNRPTDLMLRHDEAGAYVVMRVTTPFFLGQKITPLAGSLHLTLRARCGATGDPWPCRLRQGAALRRQLPGSLDASAGAGPVAKPERHPAGPGPGGNRPAGPAAPPGGAVGVRLRPDRGEGHQAGR